MNANRCFPWLLAAMTLAVAALAADKAEPSNPASGASTPAARFKQVRERADALYRFRNQPPAPPAPEENPFRPVGPVRMAGSVGTPVAAAEESTTPTDLAVLQQAVATLRVSGFFEKEGESYLVINLRAYRVGDVVPGSVRGETIYLRVREIGRNSVTLALNDTEITLKHGTRGTR